MNMLKLDSNKIYSVKHSGRCGDIILSLYLIKKLNIKVDYYLHINSIDLPLNLYHTLKPLLEYQSYINNVIPITHNKFYNNLLIDFDLFRHIGYIKFNQHIINSYIDIFNSLYPEHKLEYYSSFKWLDVPKTKIKNKYIIIHRVLRYQNKFFPYRAYINPNYELLFCGTEEEYDNFTLCYSDLNVLYYYPKDFLEFAQLVYNSEYFLGGQSVGSVIAQGLEHRQMQETCFEGANNVPPFNQLIKPYNRDLI